ncbi:hypothetical protein NBRC116590_12720 [Pelagimonas sp. KU-00592-HH]|uniref:calcium-binding protein n=1 Tax=Pelagimonas sp. KU-00592-HH TaxID=3127651 RepID=UPI003103028F
MIGLILLMGASIGLAAFLISDDDDAGSDAVGSDGVDIVSDKDYEDEINADIDDLVQSNELTAEQGQAVRDAVQYSDGPLDVETKGGNDVVLGTDQDDSVHAGEGIDLVLGGAGDDDIHLGDGDDVYGIDGRFQENVNDDIVRFPYNEAEVGEESTHEAGNDTVLGGDGDDAIADGYGNDELRGGHGDDFIISVDQDGNSPDTVVGGPGRDELVVDEGDVVETGGWSDLVIVELQEQVAEGYAQVQVTDFDKAADRLGVRVWDGAVDPEVTVADSADGKGAIVSVDGIEIVNVVGGQGLTVSDIHLFT